MAQLHIGKTHVVTSIPGKKLGREGARWVFGMANFDRFQHVPQYHRGGTASGFSISSAGRKACQKLANRQRDLQHASFCEFTFLIQADDPTSLDTSM
jgi:hypothetical protein